MNAITRWKRLLFAVVLAFLLTTITVGALTWGLGSSRALAHERLPASPQLAGNARPRAVSPGNATGPSRAAASSPSAVSASKRVWTVRAVDAPKYFADMTDRSLALDGNARPHIAYGGDRLYYAHYNGSTWVKETVDASPGVGSHAAIAVTGTTAITVHVSYYDAVNGDLKYARRDANGQWTIQTVDSAGDVGQYTSIALDQQGRPHISYYDVTNKNLKYAYWDGSQWNTETAHSDNDVGMYSSIAIDSNGHPHICYYDSWNGALYYTYKGLSWNPQMVDQPFPNAAGAYCSLALDSNEDPHISYRYEKDFDNDVRYAYYDSNAADWVTDTVATTVGFETWTSIALDAADNPHISFNGLWMTHAFYESGLGWVNEKVDNYGLYTSFAIAPSGTYTMHVSYYDGAGALKYAYWDSSQKKWVTQVVDRGADVGRDTSIALDAQGNPHISYMDRTLFNLKYASLSGTAWMSQTVTKAGGDTSLAFGGDGYPRISYRASQEFARWDGTKWVTQTVASGWQHGWDNSLALEPTSPYTPHISYFDDTGNDLRYAYWNGSQWISQTVDSGGNVGYHTSLALDGNRRPHISYYYDDPLNNAKDELRYARWDGSQWITQTVDNAGRGFLGRESTALALDRNDRPHIAYYDYRNKDLRYARWNGSQWVTQTVDSSGDVGGYAAMALDGSDRPHISYYDATNGDLKYAYWDGSQWISETVDSTGDVGRYTSITLDDAGNIYISYYDGSNKDLKYAFGRTIGVALTGAQSASRKPGQTAVYTHILTNTGSYTDTFSVAFSSSQGWASVQPTGLITLSAGATTTVKVTVTVPANAISGTVESTAVTVTSQADNSVKVTAADTTTAGHAPGVAVAPNRSGQARPGEAIAYAHTVTNTGNGPDSFTIACASSQEWSVQCAPSSVSLARGASTTVYVTVTAAANAISGTVDTTTVTAASQADSSVKATASNTTTVKRVVGVQLAPNHSGQAKPGETITYTHILTNTGNYTDTFSIASSSSRGWASVQPTGLITLSAGAITTVKVTVTVPANALSGTTETTTVTATSQADNSVKATVTDVTQAVTPKKRVYLPLVVR